MNRFLVALLTVCSIFAEALSQAPSNNGDQPNRRTSTAQTDQSDPDSGPVPDFIIGAEDVLFINVWHEPDFTVTVKVRSDGKISFPLLEDIQASGLTTNELQKRITDELNKLLNEPKVTVIVQEIHSHHVHVIGSVGRPGAYDIRGPLSVMELLARAGGLAESARPKGIVIVRTDGGRSRRFRFDYNRYVSGENLQQNISLRTGDVIIVP
jgi:polysaccharide export outer membrane protein